MFLMSIIIISLILNIVKFDPSIRKQLKHELEEFKKWRELRKRHKNKK